MDVAHDFRDTLLFLEDVDGELRGRQVCNVFVGVWVLAVEITVVDEQFGHGNFPSVLIFFALAPPGNQWREFLELDGGGFGVILPAVGQRCS